MMRHYIFMNFNSRMVRLKVYQIIRVGIENTFQFQNGTIKSSATFKHFREQKNFNSRMVRLKAVRQLKKTN